MDSNLYTDMKYIKINIMKYLRLFGFVLSILLCCNSVFSQSLSENKDNPAGEVNGNTIKIMTSPELNNLTADWISEYEKLNPGVKFSVSTINGSEINKAGTICFLSTDCTNSSFQLENQYWPQCDCSCPECKESNVQRNC